MESNIAVRRDLDVPQMVYSAGNSRVSTPSPTCYTSVNITQRIRLCYQKPENLTMDSRDLTPSVLQSILRLSDSQFQSMERLIQTAIKENSILRSTSLTTTKKGQKLSDVKQLVCDELEIYIKYLDRDIMQLIGSNELSKSINGFLIYKIFLYVRKQTKKEGVKDSDTSKGLSAFDNEIEEDERYHSDTTEFQIRDEDFEDDEENNSPSHRAEFKGRGWLDSIYRRNAYYFNHQMEYPPIPFPSLRTGRKEIKPFSQKIYPYIPANKQYIKYLRKRANLRVEPDIEEKDEDYFHISLTRKNLTLVIIGFCLTFLAVVVWFYK